MTCSPVELRAHARSLRELVRQTGAETIEELEADVVAIVAPAWEAVWPDVLDALLAPFEAAGTAEATTAMLDAGMSAGGAVLEAGDWPGEVVNEQLVETSARGYDGGKVIAEEAVGSVSRRRPVVRQQLTDEETWSIFEDVLGDERFGVDEREAAAWLAEDVQFWVGDAWDQGLGTEISDAALLVLEEGGGAAAVAAILRDTLNDRFERSENYWSVVGNATMQRSRNFGAVAGFEEAEVTSFTITAVIDERTSEQCLLMNGTVFTVSQGAALRDSFIAAESPEEVKELSPWRSAPAIQTLKNQGVGAMASAGLTLPPYHGL